MEIVVFGRMKEIKVTAQFDSRAIKMKIQVWNLGVLINSDLIFSSHIPAITKQQFIISNKQQGLEELMKLLIHAFIYSMMNYCNSLLSGLPKKAVRQLQLIQSADSRLLKRMKRTEHITPVLKS